MVANVNLNSSTMNSLWGAFGKHGNQGESIDQLISALKKEGEQLKAAGNPLGQQLINLANQLQQAESGQQTGSGSSSTDPGITDSSSTDPSSTDSSSTDSTDGQGASGQNVQLVQQLLNEASQLLSTNPQLASRMVDEAQRLMGTSLPDPFSSGQLSA
jgi:hypothetical protein